MPKDQSMRRPAVLAAVALFATLSATLTGCSSGGSSASSSANTTGPITFIGPSDPTGVYKKLIGEWNSQHANQKVTYVQYSSAQSDAERTQLVQNFQAKSSRFDVVFTNNVWTDEFAARGWIQQLKPSGYPIKSLLSAPVDTGTYKGKLYAVPFSTDGGILYYRKDLVKSPPTTFAEVATDCKTIKIPCYAGQYAQYDGLTVNFVEALADAGGSVFDSSGKPSVDTPQAHTGLETLVNGFKQGWIPKDAITYQEDPGRIAFQKGNLAFLRNWSYVDALASAKGSAVAGKFGMATLPGINGPGKSALGGWNLTLSSYSRHAKTAQSFMAWMVQEPQQKLDLEMASSAPTWSSLYDDPALIAKFPYLPVLKQSLSTAVPLPKSTNWSGTSLAIQKNAYAALQGQVSVDAALKQMQSDLQSAVAQQ